jgi:hypothetical protein
MPVEHPDVALVTDLIRDFEAWLQERVDDPTSQVTGGGAVRLAENRFGALHANRPSILLPSASYGMRAALRAAGTKPGSRVLIPGVDWGSTLAVVRSLGAVPVPIAVDPATLTLDPASAVNEVDTATSAIVMCHLHGVPADVPALRAATGDAVPIIEDCAQALGSTLDGQAVGTLADFAVFSFGPGKTIDAGEAAMVTCADDSLRDKLIGLTAHPVRQVLAGVASPKLAEFSMRVAPTSAIRLAMALGRWQPEKARARHARLRIAIDGYVGITVLGGDIRRASAAPAVPIWCTAERARALPVTTVASAAMDIPGLTVGVVETTPVILIDHVPRIAGLAGPRVPNPARTHTMRRP